MMRRPHLKWWYNMKMMRNLLVALAMQFGLTLFVLLKINIHSIIYEAITLNQIVVMIFAIVVPVLILINVIWFDRNLLDVLIDREFKLRSDVFNQEEAIRNHEIFRDINVIKILAQNNDAEALKAYMMEELDGY